MAAVSNVHWTEARRRGIVDPMPSTAEGDHAMEALAGFKLPRRLRLKSPVVHL